ncbi:hypothetical protein Tco_0894933 [Tanacetum coccineum]|uniref:Uncharacterized protein n=1 Tax=Tanacetum coccineum TaxID=301880 RepID=A0ABQ5CD32_9ASTR
MSVPKRSNVSRLDLDTGLPNDVEDVKLMVIMRQSHGVPPTKRLFKVAMLDLSPEFIGYWGMCGDLGLPIVVKVGMLKGPIVGQKNPESEDFLWCSRTLKGASNPSEQSRLESFFERDTWRTGMIRIHSAFVHDKAKSLIAHKFKMVSFPSGGNQESEPRTMAFLNHKMDFLQFRAKLVSSHRLSIFSKWVRHVEKELPKTEKSSIKTSIVFSIMSWKIAIIHLWNVLVMQRHKGHAVGRQSFRMGC